MAACGVKFDLISYFGLLFSGREWFVGWFPCQRIHFWRFVKFQIFVLAKWPILFKQGGSQTKCLAS